MKKNLPTLFCIILPLMLISNLSCKPKNIKSQLDIIEITDPGVVLESVIVKTDPELLAEISKMEGRFFHTSDGILVYTGSHESSEKPYFEIYFFKRDLNNDIKPMKVDELNFIQSDTKQDVFFHPKGQSLRIALEEKQLSTNLVLGQKYDITFNSLPKYISEFYINIPEAMKIDETLRVKVVLLDMLYEEKIAQEKERIAEEQTITLQINGFDDNTKTDRFFCHYNVKGDIDSLKAVSANSFELHGPVELGGELYVYDKVAKSPRFYSNNINKRYLEFPLDADWIANDHDYIDIYLSVEDGDSHIGLMMYRNETSEFSIFSTILGKNPVVKKIYPDFNPEKIPLKVIPGKYFVKLRDSDNNNINIGWVEISDESNKVYRIEK